MENTDISLFVFFVVIVVLVIMISLPDMNKGIEDYIESGKQYCIEAEHLGKKCWKVIEVKE